MKVLLSEKNRKATAIGPKVSHQGFMLHEAYEELDEIKKGAQILQEKLSRRLMIWDDVKNHLLVEHTAHYFQFDGNNGPDVQNLLLDTEGQDVNTFKYETDKNDNNDEGEWETVGEEKLKNQSLWDQWINCVDIR